MMGAPLHYGSRMLSAHEVQGSGPDCCVCAARMSAAGTLRVFARNRDRGGLKAALSPVTVASLLRRTR